MTRGFLLYILVIGLVMSAGSIYLFLSELDNGIDRARTVAFSTLVMFQLFIGLGSRSKLPVHKIGFFTNKRLLTAIASSIILLLLIIYLPAIIDFNPFNTVPLNIMDWLGILVISSSVFFILEFWKFLRDRPFSKQA
jgi:Ca2+-transporting ATPase